MRMLSHKNGPPKLQFEDLALLKDTVKTDLLLLQGSKFILYTGTKQCYNAGHFCGFINP